VREAVDDWLRDGLDGTSDRTRTLYEGLLGLMLDAIGARPLRVLSAGDVRSALSQLATRYSTRSLQITRNSLERAIRHAESNDLVGRNVAALVKAPAGRSGRRSKSFTLEQAKGLLAASERTRLHAYVVLSLLVGIRTEEARALRWHHVVTWVLDGDDVGKRFAERLVTCSTDKDMDDLANWSHGIQVALSLHMLTLQDRWNASVLAQTGDGFVARFPAGHLQRFGMEFRPMLLDLRVTVGVGPTVKDAFLALRLGKARNRGGGLFYSLDTGQEAILWSSLSGTPSRQVNGPLA
jgi:hypothetical protein